MKRTYIYVLFCVLTIASFAQHTPLTSQYMFNGLVINPAYAGTRDMLTTSLTYRNQWTGFEGAPVTQMITAHSPILKQKMGVGLMLFNDKIGVSKETGIYTNFAYRARLSKGFISMGIGAGISIVNANWSSVGVQDQTDQAFMYDTERSVQPNFSAGAYYKQDKFYLGISMPFMMSYQFDPEKNSYNAIYEADENNYVLTGGVIFKLSNDVVLKPSTLIRYAPNSGAQVDLNTNIVLKDEFWFGLSYRTQDAIVGMFEYQVNDQWRIGYSYDMGISDIAAYHGGSHEILLQYEFSYKTSSTNPRYF